MPKVSVVMPVYNASRFLNESINSILNQTLDDLELICVDDGSTDNSLSILNSFKDHRIKVYSRDHQGGGNARNYGLSKITGKYLYCMDADDILELNAFEECYRISEEKNLDFVVFKAINYGVEKDHFFETEYQNMTLIYDKVKDDVFSYKDLGDLLFDFNVSPWCKFYNSEFIKSTGARFRENSKFHDNQFFWDMIFKAERIYFINKFLYTRKRYDQSLTASGDIGHIDIIDVVNDIIKLFIKHNQLDNYKHKLYNLKITWITDRYKQIQEKFKAKFFRKMKNDYLSLKSKEFPDLLDEDKRFIYDCAIISKNYNDFDLMKKYLTIYENNSKDKEIEELNNKLDDKGKIINDLNNKLQENKNILQNNAKTINEFNNKLSNNEKTVNHLKNQIHENNNIIRNNEKTINDLKNKLENNEKTIADLNNTINENENTFKNKDETIIALNNKNNDYEKTIKDLENKIQENNITIKNNKNTITNLNNKNKDHEKRIENLNETIKHKDNNIDAINNEITKKNEIIKKNTLKISILEDKNICLTKKNDYLKNELNSKFSLKKLFRK